MINRFPGKEMTSRVAVRPGRQFLYSCEVCLALQSHILRYNTMSCPYTYEGSNPSLKDSLAVKQCTFLCVAGSSPAPGCRGNSVVE